MHVAALVDGATCVLLTESLIGTVHNSFFFFLKLAADSLVRTMSWGYFAMYGSEYTYVPVF